VDESKPDAGMTLPRAGRQVVDDLDLAIIAQLQEDGRRPYGQIAAHVGLSEPAVRRRVARLREQGILLITAVVDPTALGVRTVATVGVKATGDLEHVAAALSLIDEIEYVVITAGAYDLVFEAVCESTDHLLDVLNGSVRTIDGVQSTESLVHLGVRKLVYEWGQHRTSKPGRGES
jgi:Lrp/AsnC family transcriptional regulator for asnA, asnC and gidA